MGITHCSFIIIITCCLCVQGADFIDGSNRDGNGHGTHVAGQIKHINWWTISLTFVGTVIGDNYGLARKATAIAVRVINDNGSGTIAYVLTIVVSIFITHNYSGIINGVNYAAQQHAEKKVPSVAKYVCVCVQPAV